MIPLSVGEEPEAQTSTVMGPLASAGARIGTEGC